jgi:hypothetical protein|nr:MAG TPA: hypothetical protein [Bacteriophage sp.]
MKNSERAELVVSLAKSVEDSLRRREELKDTIRPGYNVQNSDSNESIIRRCVAAREELLHIIKEMKGVVRNE